ncbi:serine hydrolase domain-containing protein [Marinibacterium sp. SX1]|uniref:serine hydrolase domain-containing protein n=1 Tax=Marinibacterium sp. SX1 TaxID=3388424 RepID=UPI003D172605
MDIGDPQNLGLDPARLGRIAGWMQSYVDRRRYAGASVLVARQGREVLAHACGQRNIEAGLPFTRDTLARIYSMTKPVTSVAIMTLVERGLFPLDAPVSDFIPAFDDMQALVPGATRLDQVASCATPTIHQLLTHTSGLTYSFNDNLVAEAMAEDKLDFGPGRRTLETVTDKVAALPLVFAPGQRWEYSVSIDILGRVVEIVSGRSLDRFFAEEIFAPTGMTGTAFRVPPGTGDRFAALYTPLDGDPMSVDAPTRGADPLNLSDAPDDSRYHTTQCFSGGGGLVGTIDDYMRFAEMLRRGGEANGHRILSPATLDFMMRNHLRGEIAEMGPTSFAEQPMQGTGFGLGGSVVIDPARARTPGSVGDFSWGGMASTYFWIDRARQLSAVFFTQLAPSSSYPSRAELKALVHGAMVA